MWVSPFDKMLVINEAFILIQFKFREMADELLGMPGRDMQMDSQRFSPRIKRVYLTSLVELRSWGFFGGSIDSFKYSCNFQ
jgi:hypothetical protein